MKVCVLAVYLPGLADWEYHVFEDAGDAIRAMEEMQNEQDKIGNECTFSGIDGVEGCYYQDNIPEHLTYADYQYADHFELRYSVVELVPKGGVSSEMPTL